MLIACLVVVFCFYSFGVCFKTHLCQHHISLHAAGCSHEHSAHSCYGSMLTDLVCCGYCHPQKEFHLHAVAPAVLQKDVKESPFKNVSRNFLSPGMDKVCHETQDAGMGAFCCAISCCVTCRESGQNLPLLI